MTLPPMATNTRLDRLREVLATRGESDAMLVSHLTSIRYLTGFTGSAGQLFVSADRAVLLTDGRYATQAPEQLAANGVTAEVEVGSASDQDAALQRLASGERRVAFEATTLSWARHRDLSTGPLDGCELVAGEGLVEELRRIKDDGEVARIERAASLADSALAQVAHRLTDGPTEREFGLDLDDAMRRLGASDVSFETIVASGPNGAKPHARPADRRIEPGELVVLDFGALVDGYHSDMTRTVCVGPPATTRHERMYEVVLEAQAAGVAAVRDGADARAVDSACREVIADAGWGDAFVHGTGHGVGLDIHEFPILSATATASLVSGFVVTVEPGVYLPGEGGVRIEDSVLVTHDGCRTLTAFPKDLVIA